MMNDGGICEKWQLHLQMTGSVIMMSYFINLDFKD